MMHPRLILSARERGLRKRCPHCGVGPLFAGWNQIERCAHCGLVFEPHEGDTWFFTIIGDRLPVAVAIVVVYFNLGAFSHLLGALAFGAIVIALIWTTPNRWRAGIALHYLSRVFWPDPADPIPK
ncbi:MAG TPA: hypothetical protein VG222_04615 [Vicinamibacterales bacterium]|jgi:uncharacterized protein (DUF983 family)|nr:hypothetical protein [Vicinamibacterales bacterium]